MNDASFTCHFINNFLESQLLDLIKREFRQFFYHFVSKFVIISFQLNQHYTTNINNCYLNLLALLRITKLLFYGLVALQSTLQLIDALTLYRLLFLVIHHETHKYAVLYKLRVVLYNKYLKLFHRDWIPAF